MVGNDVGGHGLCHLAAGRAVVKGGARLGARVVALRQGATGIAETSMRVPWRAKGGSVAVTTTAATFWVFKFFNSSRVLTPRRSSMPTRLCWVKGAFAKLSPVPLRPTTRP